MQKFVVKREAASGAKKFSSWLVIGVFGGLLLIPGITQLLDAGGSATSENRALAPFPVIKQIRELKYLPKNLESYVNDRFGLRRQLVRVNSLARYKLGLSSSHDVVIGTDGWLFYAANNMMEQHTGIDVYRAVDLEHWVHSMEAVRDWLGKRNIAFYILIAPDKHTMYPEKLPNYPRRRGVKTRYDQLVERLARSRLELIDPRPEMHAAKLRGEAIYFEGDTHWTQLGAFVAYEKLMNRVAKRFPNVVPLKLEDYKISTIESPVHDLAQLLALEKDLKYRSPKMTLKRPLHQTGAPEITMKAGWGWRVSVTPNNLDNAPRLLVFGDSFTDYVLGPGMLYETFRSPVWTHHNGGTLNLNLVAEYQPDIVVVQMADRYLSLVPVKPLGMD